jgi:hypothetical protein
MSVFHEWRHHQIPAHKRERGCVAGSSLSRRAMVIKRHYPDIYFGLFAVYLNFH